MQRLLKKFETAKTMVPKPLLTAAKEPARFGCIYYGSTTPSMHDALDAPAAHGLFVNALRILPLPIPDHGFDFVQSPNKVFVVEQNPHAEVHHLLGNETGIN